VFAAGRYMPFVGTVAEDGINAVAVAVLEKLPVVAASAAKVEAPPTTAAPLRVRVECGVSRSVAAAILASGVPVAPC
jgi:hypothetical protein